MKGKLVAVFALVLGVSLPVSGIASNVYHCTGGGGSTISNPDCDLPVISGEPGICYTDPCNAPTWEYEQWEGHYVQDDNGTLTCCWDWNENDCCHLSQVDWVTMHCRWRGKRTNSDPWGPWHNCGSLTWIHGGTTIYPLVPCNGTSQYCDT